MKQSLCCDFLSSLFTREVNDIIKLCLSKKKYSSWPPLSVTLPEHPAKYKIMLLFLRAQTKAHPTTTNIGWRFHCRKNSFLLLHPFSLDWQFVEGRKEPDLYKIWNGSDNDFLWIIERDAFIHWWLHLLWKHITIEGELLKGNSNCINYWTFYLKAKGLIKF